MPLAQRSPQRRLGSLFGRRDYPWAYARKGETIWTLILLLISVGSVATVSSLDALTAHDPLGPRFLPLVNSLVLMGATVAILLKPFIRMALGGVTLPPPEPESARPLADLPEEPSKPRLLIERPLVRVAFMSAVCGSYVIMMDLIGYIPATVLGMAGALLILDTQRTRRLIIAPAVSAISIYLVFANVLHVRLP